MSSQIVKIPTLLGAQQESESRSLVSPEDDSKKPFDIDVKLHEFEKPSDSTMNKKDDSEKVFRKN